MEYLPSYTDDLYLAHHGIKGQKWGVRRFETASGHLTAEGKKRYSKNQSNSKKKKKFKLNKSTKDALKLLGINIGSAAALSGAMYLYDKAYTNKVNKENAERRKRNEQNRKEWEEAYNSYKRSKQDADDAYNQYKRAREQYSNRQNKSYTSSTKKTSQTKAKDRMDDIKNSGEKIDYKAAKEAERAAKRRVAEAQKNGNLTAEMVNDLQEAIARRKVAEQQMEHGIWIINASDDYLMHHGIKGQKWGVRRFRNYDDTLTSAGKNRYGSNTGFKKKSAVGNKSRIAKNIGKAALAAALVGGTGYALYKTGAGKQLANTGKTIILKRNELANNKKTITLKGKELGGKQNNKKAFNAPSKVERISGRDIKTLPSARKKSYPSNATRNIIDANRIASKRRKQAIDELQNGSSMRDKLFEEARAYAKLQKSKAGKKAKSSVRNRVMSGVDENDPRTWINAYRNAKDTVETVKRYGRAAKAVKNRDAISAVSSLTPEITENTNKLIDKSRKAYAKVKRKK